MKQGKLDIKSQIECGKFSYEDRWDRMKRLDGLKTIPDQKGFDIVDPIQIEPSYEIRIENQR